MGEEVVNSVCKCLSFSTKVCYHSAMTVSIDGVLVLSTDRGLYVTKLLNCPEQKDPHLTYKTINIVSSPPLTFDVGVDRKTLHKKFRYEHCDDMLNVMMDRTVSPGMRSNISYNSYKLARWSPRGADPYCRPVLAALTLDHRLTVYQVDTNKKQYELIFDLSLEFNKVLQDENFAIVSNRIAESPNSDKDFTRLQERTYALAAVDVVWSDIWIEKDKKRSFSLLLSAMKSGHLVLWKVLFPVTNQSFELLEMVDMCHVIPSCMHIIRANSNKCVLFVGFIDGTVKSYTILIEDDEFEVCDSIPLWTNADQIIVGPMEWIDNLNALLIGKGAFLLAFHLDINTTDDNLVITNQSHLMVSDKLPLTGICNKDDVTFLSVLDGTILQCQIIINESALKFELIPFQIRRPPGNHKWGSHGVTLSHNCVYLFETCSPISNYDHLVMKEPLKVNCVPLKTIREVVIEILSALESDRKFYELDDLLICVKSHILSQGGIPQELAHFVSQKKTTESLTSLKIKRYLLQVMLTQTTQTGTSDTKAEIEDRIEKVEKLILLKHICDQLKDLIKTGMQLTLTGNDITCICLMCKFVQNCSLSEHQQIGMAKSVCKVFSLSTDGSLPSVLEKCKICNADISTKYVYKEGCPNGHNIGRCCQTFMICQELPYRACENCSTLAVSNSIKGSEWFEKQKKHKCTFCDGCVK